MGRKQKNGLRAALAVASLCIVTLSFPDNALALRRHVKVPVARRWGTVFANLPAGHRTVFVNRVKYFYHSGVFYRHGRSGYVVIRAPIGAVIGAPPAGYRTVVVGGATYYAYNGDYYQNGPTGYVAVQAPPVVNPAPGMAGRQVSVTAYALSVRSGPGLDHPVIEHVWQGTVLAVQGSAPGWLYVRAPSGRLGWVSAPYTVLVRPVSRG
jgi:uncharacterized protein YgiM (DUF1202 family)